MALLQLDVLAAMAPDPEDLFRDACRNSHKYPENLQDLETWDPSLATVATEYRKDTARLWDPDMPELDLLEIYSGANDYEKTLFEKVEDLQSHLWQGRKDPLCRFAFVEADHGRAPLNCSSEMFNLLATHHQVAPAFIGNVLSFGEQNDPLDFNLMSFQHQDNLFARSHDIAALPSLGRSGREIRHFFNLRSIEPSESEPDWSWSIRNVAVYHSFDVETGRSFWLTLKANGKIRERIDSAVLKKRQFSSESLKTVDGSFISTLETLWTFFDWSDQHLRPFINDLDAKLGKIVVKAKTAPIDRYAKMPGDLMKALKRKATEKSMGQPQRANSLAQSVRSNLTAITRMLPIGSKSFTANLAGKAASVNPIKAVKGAMADVESDGEDENRVLESLAVLKTFTFEELQRLHHVSERIKEGLLLVRLLLQVVQSMREYYQDTFASPLLPQQIRDGCQPEMALFNQRMKNLERTLKIREKQLESMAQMAQDGKALFDGILQYRNMQISLLFAQSGYDSSKKMENIAHKTEQETTSMHVITFVTLLFLPGTFIATFFQSGIIKVNQPESVQGDWMLLPGAWGLFAEISFPMMVIVFLIWGVTYGCLTRRSRNRRKENWDNV